MSLSYREHKNIGIIAFDQPDSKVNVLMAEVLKRFEAMLGEVEKKTHLQALILLSQKKDVFIAGADIKEIEGIKDPQEGTAKAQAGQRIMDKLEDLKVPTFAVIDGVALGGGCELALACLYRLSTFNPKVQIGLPEVKLGIFPGFGGTYRMPRMVGLTEGLTMVLSGKAVDSKKALKMGLVDQLFTQKGLEDQVFKYVQNIIDTKKIKKKYNPPKKKGIIGFMENNALGRSFIFRQSRKNVLKESKGFYPSPLAALGVIQRNFYSGREKGMEIEATEFGKVAVSDVSKNLIKVFYLSEKFRKLNLEGADIIKPQPIKKAAVLGAGVMGGGIAQLLGYKHIWCRLKDINHDAIAKGYQAAYKLFSDLVKRRRLTKAEADVQFAHITATTDYSGFQSVDIVIEAVVENMDIKKKVFKELSGVVNPNCILATNTSALSVTEMAQQTKDPSKVIGFHFFNPVHRMPLIEVITTQYTSPETIVSSLNLVKTLGKTPILVKDSYGFIVNRILLRYLNEAGYILDECGQMEAIDKLMTDFGMPMGPFTLCDEVGLDVGIKVLKILEHGFGERFKPGKSFERIYEMKLLGKKSGKGYYIHASKKRTPNPEVTQTLNNQPQKYDSEKSLKRMVYGMINEAAMCLEEKIVSDPDSIDVGMIFGTGFPPFRGGLLRYADSLGIEHMVATLETLAKDFNAPRFQPSAYLKKLQATGKTFYS